MTQISPGQALQSLAPIPPDEMDRFLSLCTLQELKRGETFLREGDIPVRFAFSASGLLRYFYVDADGNEFTKGFFPEGRFIVSYSAMVEHRPSHFTIEALEDCLIHTIHHADWERLRQSHRCWNEVLVALLTFAYSVKEEREREFLLLDAESRYRLFLQRFPGLDRRVRQHHIASYLGITPVALSRIRKKMGIVNTG